MTTQLDGSIGLKAESTFGTAVTVDTFLEPVESVWDANLEFVQGKGGRPGSRLARAGRRRPGKRSGTGRIVIEAPTTGLGKLLKAALGTATSTLVPSSTAYQQVHTPSLTDPQASYTVQVGTPPVGGGSVSAVTYKGVQCDSLEISAKLGDHVMVTTEWTAKDWDTAIAYAAPSYPATLDLFTFIDVQLFLSGTLTLPTTTALATASGQAAANIRDFLFKWKNNLDSEGYNLGGGGARTRPAVLGMAELTTEFTAEFTDNTYRDLWLNGTPGFIVATATFPTAINASVYPVLQIVIPVGYLDGEMAKASADGSVITQKFTHQGRDGLSASAPVYVVYRTADTAI